MSAFLGPIHSWLFQKIEFQNEFVNRIIDLGTSQYGLCDLENELNLRYGTLEQGELADIVDESNIHGWLQQRVSLVEIRFAAVVTNILKDHTERIDDLEQLMFEIGKEHAVSSEINAKECWNHLNNILLDGMPCDHVNKVIIESENEVRYQIIQDIHGSYWNEAGGSVSDFYVLKQSLINGLLSNTQFVLEPCGDEIWRLVGR